MNEKIQQLLRELYQECDEQNVTMIGAIGQGGKLGMATAGDAALQFYLLDQLKTCIVKNTGIPEHTLTLLSKIYSDGAKSDLKSDDLDTMKEIIEAFSNGDLDVEGVTVDDESQSQK